MFNPISLSPKSLRFAYGARRGRKSSSLKAALDALAANGAREETLPLPFLVDEETRQMSCVAVRPCGNCALCAKVGR